jgi:hypothetical protein
LLHPLHKETVRCFDLAARRALSAIYEREVAATIPHAREDLVSLAPLLESVDEVVFLNFRRELIPAMRRGHIAHDAQEDRQGRHPLLPIDDLVRGDDAGLVSIGDGDDRAHEVATVLCARLEKLAGVLHQLIPVRRAPRVVTLEHRDHVLVGGVEQLLERSFGCFHVGELRARDGTPARLVSGRAVNRPLSMARTC